MLLVVMTMTIGSILLLSYAIVPLFQERIRSWQLKKERKINRELDNLFYDKGPQNILRLYFILPIVFGTLAFIVSKMLLFAALGVFLGLITPNFVLKIRNSQHHKKFSNQILDMIMILSSSLKAGLSLTQALEVILEEMPAPMSQEIGLVVRKMKMGLALEDGLNHLKERMKLEELDLVINSLLVARETGGDLPKVLSRLSNTIRDTHKLKDSVKTLTLQGRMQGIIMSVLPFVFVWWVLIFNKQHFNIMLEDETGRLLLFIAVVLQIIGIFLIKKFSAIKI